jgi:hypothetical protein
VSDYRSICQLYSLNAPSLFGRGSHTSRKAMKWMVREVRGSLFPSVMSGGTFFYFCFQFRSNASTNSAVSAEWSTGTDLILILALLACFFCDTACSTALEAFREQMIAPCWHRARGRRAASIASSPGGSRSLRQWLCSPSRNEKNTRPFRSVHISHNPPPRIPSLSICGCT